MSTKKINQFFSLYRLKIAFAWMDLEKRWHINLVHLLNLRTVLVMGSFDPLMRSEVLRIPDVKLNISFKK